MTNKKLNLLLFILIILPPAFILLSREFFEASYFTSSIYKLIFLFPILFRILAEKKKFKEALTEHFSLSAFKKNILKAFGIGIAFIAIYLSTFYLFKDHLNLDNTIAQLNEMASINVSNILAIGLYIIVLNSLLEEFFWRGFLFDKLFTTIRPWLAYLITGIAFSFHHMVFYYNWFEPVYLVIITVGLSIYAMLMNLIFAKTKDLFTCWLVHACADIAQIFIALKLFQLL